MKARRWTLAASATLLALLFQGGTPDVLDAQSELEPPRLAVSAGVGQTFGGFGATVEAFVAQSRVSFVGGAGWVPSLLLGDGHASYALAVRGFLGSGRLRGYAEAAWSSYGSTTRLGGITGGGLRSEIHYGLGLSGGLHVLIPRGFSVIGGLGKFTSSEQASGAATVANVGLGITFPR